MGFADTLQNFKEINCRVYINWSVTLLLPFMPPAILNFDFELCDFAFWFDLAEWRIYSDNYMAQLTFCYMKSSVLMNILNAYEVAIYTFRNIF